MYVSHMSLDLIMKQEGVGVGLHEAVRKCFMDAETTKGAGIDPLMASWPDLFNLVIYNLTCYLLYKHHNL